jgi:hypothetical protein
MEMLSVAAVLATLWRWSEEHLPDLFEALLEILLGLVMLAWLVGMGIGLIGLVLWLRCCLPC